MRHPSLTCLLVICLAVPLGIASLPVAAQSVGVPQDTPPASPPAASATPPAAASGARLTPRQRFAAANTTHDGHLTRAQATQGGMKALARHFEAVDKDHKGYVTIDDLRSYAAAQRQARAAAKAGKT